MSTKKFFVIRKFKKYIKEIFIFDQKKIYWKKNERFKSYTQNKNESVIHGSTLTLGYIREYFKYKQIKKNKTKKFKNI